MSCCARPVGFALRTVILLLLDASAVSFRISSTLRPLTATTPSIHKHFFCTEDDSVWRDVDNTTSLRDDPTMTCVEARYGKWKCAHVVDLERDVDRDDSY